MTFLSLLSLALLFSGSAEAQRNPQSLLVFGTVKTFRCDFAESEGRRTTPDGVASPAKRETFSDLVIDSVDYQGRTARLIGNAGSETVQVFDGRMTVSFLEITLMGNVNVLSIFKATGSIDRYRAVYSRHSMLTTGELITTQSYGTCRGLL